jgi:phosphocarrier protein
MVSAQTKIVNKTGLHARPASAFVMKAKEFESAVTLKNLDTDGNAVNANSIMLILAQGLSQGTNIEIAADGPDEQKAVDELVALIDSGFGE